MAVLTTDLRRQLENVIIAAHDQAESAARSGLKKLGVDAAKPHEHFGPQDKALRNQLRARARQAGDRRADNGTQEIEQITQELAYEYWHRMLFARFLAENHLLMHPSGVSVTLEECEELAPGEGAANGFVLAARYASGMLPQIFRTDDVLLEIEFPANDRIPLEKLLASLPAQTFTADDSLGWVYQFWQSKRKDEVNAKGDKIDARSISAVTQLFTEHYMVLFLLHNTIGAWHAGKVLAADPALAQSAAGEDELRKAVALKDAGGYTFEYLRFVRGAGGTTGPWRPAGGTFDGWPKTAAELKVLDPCCGSGHFLLAGFELLVRLRMEEEALCITDAIDAVLRDNLHGLELDSRCTQIAAFNLAIAAWKLGGYRPLPPLNIACTGIGPQGKKEDWLKLADAEPLRHREPIRYGLRLLYDTFIDAPTLGSLIDPKAVTGTLGAADYETIAPVLAAAAKATEQPDNESGTADTHADAITAQGLLKAAELLGGPPQGYSVVITNVPYLGRGKQDPILQAWAEEHELDAKADLATVFVSRSLKWLAKGGSLAVVSPQNWLFLSTYKKFRERLLLEVQWDVVTRLGTGAFDTIGGAVVNVALLVLTCRDVVNEHAILGLDASSGEDAAGKAALLRGEVESATGAEIRSLSQLSQRANPDSVISTHNLGAQELLNKRAFTSHGQGSFDAPRFESLFWEIPKVQGGWVFRQSTTEKSQLYGGCTKIFRWENGTGQLAEMMRAKELEGYTSGKWRAGTQIWGRIGVLMNQMSNLSGSIYLGHSFDENTCAVVPHDVSELVAVWCCCSSDEFTTHIRRINQKVNVNTATLAKVPFDLAHWQAVAAEKYPDGLPEPETNDPTQWLFHGRPEVSEQPLQVAVARLAGYRWPTELDAKMRLSGRARALVQRSDELLKFTDGDGILPIPATRGENPLAERVTELLAAAYGMDWSPAVMHKLLADAGMKAGASLDDWLRNAFFEQHCKLFHQRPFVWQIWDGRRDGFNVLVNYHKLDHKRLDTLTHSYLGEWIDTQAADAKAGKTGADLRLAAAQALHKKLELILAGEKPYDIFVRWKAVKDQPIGWNPDLNDGVRMNIRPFVEADVLRKTPNIKWTKDRGKDPETAPWFKVFKGERINDHHLSLDEKRRARAGKG